MDIECPMMSHSPKDRNDFLEKKKKNLFLLVTFLIVLKYFELWKSKQMTMEAMNG